MGVKDRSSLGFLLFSFRVMLERFLFGVLALVWVWGSSSGVGSRMEEGGEVSVGVSRF